DYYCQSYDSRLSTVLF
nr:immunoglobulin light chain junction region [Macaca mulatta]MOX18080.1 immunoglobulin light chain junction region [Macaca mulatta]MOX18632.1 immunoglobulin light chain junction region [Macaca mulatta]MOX18766.1 immunoglobulin light chain junction region [Macaca mulatta]MOX18843.1 immunoglobulin light chain junction region [Macaca mulatta]